MNVDMISKNIISILILLTIFLTSTLGVFIYQPLLATANLFSTEVEAVASTTSNTCPIEGSVWASFNNAEDKTYVEDIFYSEIVLTNDTTYTLGGERLVVAVYKSSLSTVPSYWTVLSDEYMLLPKTSLSIVNDLDLSVLPAGEYKVKVFSIQGDETALLGAVLRDTAEVDGVTLIKSTPKKSDVSILVTVNDQVYEGKPIIFKERTPLAVQIKTKNNNNLPLVGSSMLGVVTQGNVPLGTAVRIGKLDVVKLIPGGTRVTSLTDNFVEGGKYTVYAGLVSPNAFSPLVEVPVIVSESEYEGSWSYVSRIGLSNYPLQLDSDVVACISNIGSNKGRDLFSEPLGLKLTLSTEAGEIFAKKLNSLEADTDNYFIFNPQTQVSDFSLTVDLFQKRFSPEAVVSDELPSNEILTDELFLVDTIIQSFVCVEGDTCRQITAGSSNENKQAPQRPFWFYAGIVIAAALLLYIMLRRLPPEKGPSTKSRSSNELQ